MRRFLVVVQIGISLVLIIISIVIFQQVDFLKNKDLGFEKENVVTLPLGISNRENPEVFERFKNEIEANPNIMGVSAAFTHPSSFGTKADNVVYNGKKLNILTPLSITSVDYGYIETLKIQMLKGRSFSRELGNERGNLIVNETLETLMGVDDALNKVLHIGDEYQGTIIGVMKDFHIEPVSGSTIAPLILFCNPYVNNIFVRIKPEHIPSTLDAMEKAWEKAAPLMPFRYSFLDDEFNWLYKDVENLGSILKYFTLLAGFIACLGLLGLSSYATEKRTKEIGVRKVLGASVTEVVTLLCRDLLMLVLVANLIAWPAAWLFLQKWLQNFAYRVDLGWGIFLLSGVLALGVSLLTVSIQTIRASLANPVDSLRYE